MYHILPRPTSDAVAWRQVQFPELQSAPHETGSVLKNYQKRAFAEIWSLERDYFNIYRSDNLFIPDLYSFFTYGNIFFTRLVNKNPQIHGEAFTGHLHQVEAGLAGTRSQIWADIPTEVQDIHVFIND